MQDPYLYVETEVLVNLFDERNENRLKEIEANYTSLRLRQLFESPIKGRFGFAHLCKMHKFIFQDIGDKSNYEYLQRIVFDAMGG
jgi:cell filamentation protein